MGWRIARARAEVRGDGREWWERRGGTGARKNVGGVVGVGSCVLQPDIRRCALRMGSAGDGERQGRGGKEGGWGCGGAGGR
jgi:hypothetical protein